MATRVNILVIHGPNLQLLGARQPEIYGHQTLKSINDMLKRESDRLDATLTVIQTNHEGVIAERIGQAKGVYDAILINPAGYSHTSIAIRDAIEAAGLPAVEVHLSNIAGREEFRRQSVIAPVCRGQVSGLGSLSYRLGLEAVVELARTTRAPAPVAPPPAPRHSGRAGAPAARPALQRSGHKIAKKKSRR